MGLTVAQAVKKLIMEDPFYGLFLMSLDRQFDNKITKTACVCRNGINIELRINEEYWNSLEDKYRISILKHEISHILFRHLWMVEDFEDADRFNIACDMEVNSYIEDIPFGWYTADLYKYPSKCGTKWYYEHVPPQPNPPQNHNWKDFRNCSNAEKQLIQNQIDHIARSVAENVEKMHGTIPGCFKEYIDGLFAKRPAVFNWKSYFRRVVGNSIKSFMKSTRYRPSFRFKDQPGNVLKFKPKILVAVDTSGSISNNELIEFFSELKHLHKSGVSIDVVEFDTIIQNKFVYKGDKTKIEICGGGGTDATEAFKYYIEHRCYSTLVIFTDGCLSIDLPHAHNVVWVISSNGAHQNYPGISIYIPKNNT